MHVRSGGPATGALDGTTHCLIVFVPLDRDGNAIKARIWRPVSAEDISLEQHALHLIELRANIDG